VLPEVEEPAGGLCKSVAFAKPNKALELVFISDRNGFAADFFAEQGR
jgi:hypothetical protein